MTKIQSFILYSSCLFLCGIAQLQAQNTATTSGGEASGSGGTISYSIGQVSYQTFSGAGGTQSQGVQQAYEIFVLTAVPDIFTNISATAFPNPTTDQLTVRISGIEGQEIRYQLFDLQGKQLAEQTIVDTQTSIPFYELAAGTYFIQILADQQSIKTFKILKNQ